ncbi:MAG TPA: transaldolase family protein [Spirochaetia bacterium]|nr:transaldolase family protein [Spirochaetia bacterium]
MTATTPTALWNDSCSLEELSASIAQNGAVGATANPVIVLSVLKKEFPFWKDRIAGIIREMRGATEDGVAWRLVEEMSIKAAKLLEPVFRREHGRNGRLSIQTDPRLYRDTKAIVLQAERFNALAPNVITKIPVTAAGIPAIEEATFLGISVNATVSFTLPQAVAVAEAVERGLSRREKEGKDTSGMGPVCTLMVGRLDDWLKAIAEKKGIIVNPSSLEWAGVAVFKKAYGIYRKRGYRLRLLSAAFRNHLHWSQLIGGDVVISPPFEWQKRFNESEVSVEDRIGTPVDPALVDELIRKFPDFRKAYDENGLPPEEFDSFGASVRTLRQFCKATEDLAALMRDSMLPDPG